MRGLIGFSRTGIVVFYSGCQKNVPFFGRFFLQPLMPHSLFRNINMEKGIYSDNKLYQVFGKSMVLAHTLWTNLFNEIRNILIPMKSGKRPFGAAFFLLFPVNTPARSFFGRISGEYPWRNYWNSLRNPSPLLPVIREIAWHLAPPGRY